MWGPHRGIGRLLQKVEHVVIGPPHAAPLDSRGAMRPEVGRQPEDPMEDGSATTRDGSEAKPTPLVELAREAASGDNAAMSRLLRVVAPKLIAVVRAILGSAHPDVDDAVQQ